MKALANFDVLYKVEEGMCFGEDSDNVHGVLYKSIV